MKLLCLVALASLSSAAFLAAAEPDPVIAAVTEIEKVSADPARFKDAEGSQTVILKSEEEAKKYFGGDALTKLTSKVDFSKQFVLIFAWKGSGQDRMNVTIQESYPEKALFKREPGRTRDLRQHVRIYALRSNVKWKVQ